MTDLNTCIETQKFVGTRGYCDADPSITYKLYVEDLNGLSTTAFSNIATTSGRNLIDKAIKEGFRRTLNDALYYEGINSGTLSTNQLLRAFYQQEFSTVLNTIPVVPTERGLNVSLTNTTHYQMSSLSLRNIYIKLNQNETDLQVNFYSEGVLLFSDVIPSILSGVVYTHMPSQPVIGRDIDVTFEQNGIETYQATIKNDSSCGCKTFYLPKSCSTDGYSYTTDKKITVTGGFGVTADVDLVCLEDKIMCALLPYLIYEARLAAGIYLAQEVQVTDRLNFFTLNNKEDIADLAEGWNREYWDNMKSKAKRLRYVIKGSDTCCFPCTGFNIKTQII